MKDLPPGGSAVSRSVVIAARLALLLAAALAGLAAFSIAFGDRGTDSAGALYVCPMHPEVQAAKLGQCPICGMALELNARGPGSMHDATPMMMDLTAVENVRRHKVLDFVRVKALPSELRELRGAAWVEPDRTIRAVFYRDQAQAISADDAATFTLTQTPETHFDVRLSAEPPLAWDRATSQLHFTLKFAPGKGAPGLSPGQVGWLELERKPRSVLAVPADAILESPQGPYVLRSLGDFKFEKRSIEIAETFSKQGIAVVLSGLQAQDRVVGRAAFFLDADRRLQNHLSEEDWGTP
jgi:heavy metal-binding protein